MNSVLIKNALIVTVDNDMKIIRNGYLVMKKDIIIDIGEMQNLEENNFKEIIDAKNKIVMPGLINAHTHIAMAFFKGLADDLPLKKWLNDYIWPAENKLLNFDFVKDASAYGISDLIKNGTTTFSDMYFLEDAVAESVEKIGVRGILGEGVVDFPIAGFKNATEKLDKTRKLYEKYKENKRIEISVAPHSIYACSRDTLLKVSELARELDIVQHIHLSESKGEVKSSLKDNNKRPGDYLLDLGFFDNTKTVISHGVWFSTDEIRKLAAKDVHLSLCTESNLKLASGFARIAELIKEKLPFCYGTDGVASNNNLSLLEEMGYTAKLAKALGNDPTLLSAKRTIKNATITAASAYGLDNKIGSLEKGKQADLIFIDINNVETQPIYDVYSHLVYNISSDKITDLFVAGKRLMRDRKLLTVNETAMLNKAREYKKRVIEAV